MDFSRTRFSLRRPLTSYVKVQRAIGATLRSRTLQLAVRPTSDYLNLGCGANVRAGFLNVDYHWRPGVLCWDVTRGLPAATGSMRGVFSEHCLEHMPLPEGYALLEEVHRAMADSAVLRIVVPDAELYLRGYAAGASARFPYQEQDEFMGIRTPLMSVNRVFYVQRDELYGHNFMYDFETLARVLERVGFTRVVRRAFGEGADPKLLIDSDARRPESLYVEAVR